MKTGIPSETSEENPNGLSGELAEGALASCLRTLPGAYHGEKVRAVFFCVS